jgi:hypothetical protein
MHDELSGTWFTQTHSLKSCDKSGPKSESWSEWQDLNLRPPRPEQVSLSESSMFIGNPESVRRPLFAFGFVISVGKLSGWNQPVGNRF